MENRTFSRFAAIRVRDGSTAALLDMLAEEVPVALEYNGVSHAVMLATPADLEDFARGFSLTEGIIAAPGDFYGCELWEEEEGLRLAVDIAAACFFGLKEKRRNLTGRTGCGLCGAESLQYALRQPPPVASSARFSAAQLYAGFDRMAALQVLKAKTGATHAAAWMAGDGRVQCVREDVGRHNALDKLIGALAVQGTVFGEGALLLTSRASYEMVQKAASVGIGIIAAASAPTALAVRVAEKAQVTLAGFVRGKGHTVYTRPERLA